VKIRITPMGRCGIVVLQWSITSCCRCWASALEKAIKEGENPVALRVLVIKYIRLLKSRVV
jgi:hypothetical protein